VTMLLSYCRAFGRQSITWWHFAGRGRLSCAKLSATRFALLRLDSLSSHQPVCPPNPPAQKSQLQSKPTKHQPSVRPDHPAIALAAPAATAYQDLLQGGRSRYRIRRVGDASLNQGGQNA
jgi:hypothetical protein